MKNNNKIVVIMRGISGSGKSTYTAKHFPGAVVCSADHYFSRHGKYEFDASKLGAAHEHCKSCFKDAIKNDEDLIVVDNTNTMVREMSFYFDYAKNHGYDIRIIRLHAPVQICAGRNTHGVPVEACKRMNTRMASIPLDWGVAEEDVNTAS